MEAISAINLSKSFKGKYAVHGLNMHVPEGSIYGFIGENGAGKSTTQKMICGLLLPTKGKLPCMVSRSTMRMFVLGWEC